MTEHESWHLPDGREIRVEIPEGSLAIHFKKPANLSDTPL